MNSYEQLHNLGQSLWYDNIQRKLIENGDLARMIQRGEIRGVTSNPSIFHNAIARSHDYDSALQPMAWAGWTAEQIFNQLAMEDIRAAADLFRPLYDGSRAGDGYVSLEVSPYLANNTAGTITEAKRLWQEVNRPNLMIKIPATPEGIPAIQESIAAGINVNVTLIFSLTRYNEVINAYLAGLETRAAAGLPIENIASVASFFVSRVDSKIDALLHEIVKKGGSDAEKAAQLLGKAAIANARMAYALFRKEFGTGRYARLRKLGARFQRPLWASTSTKDPSYSDVMYIEQLIGPDTVNTVPPLTLAAFGDHGKSAITIDNQNQSWQELNDLTALGISMDDVTQQLELEGVKSFSDAFTALLETVDERRAEVQNQLGPLKLDVIAPVAQLKTVNAAQRVWDGDPTFWTEDPKAHAEIKNRLGWISAPEAARKLLPELQEVMYGCQSSGYTKVLLLGMGGSSLAPEVFAMTFGVREDSGQLGLDLQILDSTDPAQVQAAERISPVDKTLFIVSSKSGTTSEVNAYLNYFWDKAVKKLGSKAPDHFVAITDPGTPLEKLAQERNFRRVIRADASVGGRYSALIAFGLLPATLLGINMDRFISSASWMAAQCAADVPAERNPGLVLGAILGQAALQGRDKVTILADPELSAVGSWMEQLIAESSGKHGKGIVPIDIEPLIAAKQYENDRLFVYLRLSGTMQDQAAKLLKAGQPVLTFLLNSEYDLPAEMYRWEMATAYACSVMGINAFDQPDVQDNKTLTQQKIAEYLQGGTLEEGKPIWQGDEGRVYGRTFIGLESATCLKEVVEKFLKQTREGDYVAINAYLPRNDKNLVQLQKFRAWILKQTHKATTLGFGPRFLHSTGQLHKGGANNGVFIQITADPSKDIQIPGQAITFGVLERAQALGDLESLLSRGRRVIRIHLDGASVKDLF